MVYKVIDGMNEDGRWLSLRRGNRQITGLIAIILIFGLALVIRSVPVLAHEIHWVRYGYDRVWYHNRTYIDPSSEMALNELEQKFGEGQRFIATGDKVIGLPVYDTPRSLAFQRQRKVVSTLLFLRKPDGNFIVYPLSGGP